MLICLHRINEPARLADVPSSFGVEIDIRSLGERLILVHDAFSDGPDLDDWLDAYRHAFVVVNIKEEGLEQRIAEKFAERGITDWAFLDESFPYLVKTLRSGSTKTMVRVSEYESHLTALALSPSPDWVWVDSFTGAWPDSDVFAALRERGMRTMLVSPELQGRSTDEIADIRRTFADSGVLFDGVCTKRADLWA